MSMEDHQTLVALTAILLWPIASLWIFARSRTFSHGLIWSVLAAQLLLPVGAAIKFQMIPQIDKVSIANFSALLGCLIFGRAAKVERSRRFGLIEILLLLSAVSPIITSELNPDNIIIGDRFLPGVGLYDALSAAEAALIALIPFWLGRRFLRTADDCHNILLILAIAGLSYSVPLLFEICFSPQLHNWVYGYYPTEFVQAMREGGFRPMVFMGHGLLAAFFLMTSILAAATLWRSRVQGWHIAIHNRNPLSWTRAPPFQKPGRADLRGYRWFVCPAHKAKNTISLGHPLGYDLVDVPTVAHV